MHAFNPFFIKKQKFVQLPKNEVTDFILALVATLCKLILPSHRLAQRQAYSQRHKEGYIATLVVYALQQRESKQVINLPTD